VNRTLRRVNDHAAAGGRREPAAIRRRLGHLPAGLATCAALAVLAPAVAGAAAGWPGALGALAGVALVAVNYTISGVAVAWADSVNPALVLPVGMATYAVKFTLLGVALVALLNTGWPGLPPMGLSILAATLAWTIAHTWWAVRAKIPYVEPDAGSH
jgi:hypothetical protein